MTVYVDNARHPYRRMLMCHMIADTLSELHEMADKIGVDRRHFQAKRIFHYDICNSKRRLAIKLGATTISSRELVRVALAIKNPA